jgi:hypothetical protein
MRIVVQADDGDEVSINTNVISAEQAVVTLQIKNPIYDSVAELEEVTLTIDKARDLAWAAPRSPGGRLITSAFRDVHVIFAFLHSVLTSSTRLVVFVISGYQLVHDCRLSGCDV